MPWSYFDYRFKQQQDVLTNEVNMDVINHDAPVITYYMELSTPI